MKFSQIIREELDIKGIRKREEKIKAIYNQKKREQNN